MRVYFVGVIFLVLFATGCWKEKTVTITKDYVINPNWDEIGNGFVVFKMKLKDNNTIIDLKDPTEPELYYGLIKDTSFSHIANVRYNGTDYSKRKVYFNRDNGFLWGNLNDMHSECEQKILGELQQETWYLLLGLSPLTEWHYVYLDTSDSLHVYKVSGMTNY